jgi:hypothetical protein
VVRRKERAKSGLSADEARLDLACSRQSGCRARAPVWSSGRKHECAASRQARAQRVDRIRYVAVGCLLLLLLRLFRLFLPAATPGFLPPLIATLPRGCSLEARLDLACSRQSGCRARAPVWSSGRKHECAESDPRTVLAGESERDMTPLLGSKEVKRESMW